MMDNRQFNVNGEGEQMLLRALELACIQEGSLERPAEIAGYLVRPDYGMILLWHVDVNDKSCVSLPSQMSYMEILPMVWTWLRKGAIGIKCEGWDANASHDGSNVLGWRVYCEDWGHVAGYSNAICAVKPAYLWMGK